MRVFPCPICGTVRNVKREELELIVETNQFMCWDSCGTDVFLPPMYVFFHTWWNDKQEE